MKKEFTLRLDDAACAELENLKKLSGEKTDAKAIRFAIQNYAKLMIGILKHNGKKERGKINILR